MARYFVGDGTSTDWFDTDNWSTESCGVGGASVPGIDHVANFDIGSSGNCILTAPLNTGGLTCTNDYSYTLNDGGYAVGVSGDINWQVNNTKLVTTGTWTQIKDSISAKSYPNGNDIYNWVMPSGKTLTCPYYFHVNQCTIGPDCTVNGGGNVYFICWYPPHDHFYYADPTSSVTGVRFYINTDRANSGVVMDGNFMIPYGAAGKTYTTLGDITVGGYLHVHAGNTATTEAQARTLDMNGYNLYVTGDIQLGQDTTSYDGYGGRIIFGSGTWIGGNLKVNDYNVKGNTYAYIVWGSGEVHVDGDINLTGVYASYTQDADLHLDSVTEYQDVWCSGNTLPDVHLSTSLGLNLHDDFNCTDMHIYSNNRDKIFPNGFDIIMPARVEMLKQAATNNNLLIRKQWVN